MHCHRWGWMECHGVSLCHGVVMTQSSHSKMATNLNASSAMEVSDHSITFNLAVDAWRTTARRHVLRVGAICSARGGVQIERRA
jgi:hypothetical protein